MSTSSHDTSSELERDIDACKAAVDKELQAERDDALDTASLHTKVSSLIEQEKGFVAQLRSLPTPRRIALVFCAVTAVGFLTLVTTPRADMSLYPAPRMLVSVTLLGLLTAAAAWRLLRPLHKPPPAKWSGPLLLLAGLALASAGCPGGSRRGCMRVCPSEPVEAYQGSWLTIFVT